MAVTLDPPKSDTVIYKQQVSVDDQWTQYIAVPNRHKSPSNSIQENAVGFKSSSLGSPSPTTPDTVREEKQNQAASVAEEETDVGYFSPTSPSLNSSEIEMSDGETIRLRSELAKDIHDRIIKIAPYAGDLSLATYIQLLKRDLSRCHDVLHDHPTEQNFLSIITLIEAAISQKKWRDYDSRQFEKFKNAIDIGYRQPVVSFTDYKSVRDEFAKDSIDTFSTLDSVEFDWESIENSLDEE